MDMQGFSDELIGLDITHKREMRNVVSDAQRIVDGKDQDIGLLIATVSRLQEELRTEKAKRMAAEFRLEQLLDMPID